MPFVDRSSNRSLLLIIIAVVSAGTIAFIARKSGGRLKQLKDKKQRLKLQKQRLTKKKDKLTTREKRLHQDPYLIKKLAQEKLGFVQPGEKRLWFLESKNKHRSDTLFPSRSKNQVETPVLTNDVVDMPDTLLFRD